jgi:hypothetical protein
MVLNKNKNNKKSFMKLSLYLQQCGLMEAVLEVVKTITKFLISLTVFSEV